jgi:type I restriction enzyme, S subunit
MSSYPKTWIKKRLKEIMPRLDAGVSVKSNEKDLDIFGHGKYILKTSCVSQGKFIPNEKKEILPSDLVRAKYNPKKDSIIISRMNTPEFVGECGYVDRDYDNLYLPDRLWITRPTVNSRWLSYNLGHGVVFQTIKDSATGTSDSMKNISKATFLEIEISIPTNKEQEAIANALSDADAYIESLEKLIAKKRLIKKGVMQELLTGKRRLTGFKDKWIATSLGKRGVCIRGVSYNPNHDLAGSDSENTVRLLRSNNIQQARIENNDVQFVKSYRVSQDQFLVANDIVICMANGSKALVGKSGKFNTNDGCKYTFGSFMACFRPDNMKINPAYAFFLFQTEAFRSHIDVLLAGSSINNLTPASIESFQILIPSDRAEQQAISLHLQDIETEIELMNIKVSKARLIKQGMMQELLTGRIRLV